MRLLSSLSLVLAGLLVGWSLQGAEADAAPVGEATSVDDAVAAAADPAPEAAAETPRPPGPATGAPAQRKTIANQFGEVSLSNWRASIGSFALTGEDMHPLPLPEWRQVPGRDYTPDEDEPRLPVLDLFNQLQLSQGWATTDMHNFLFGLGLVFEVLGDDGRVPAEPYWTVVPGSHSEDSITYEYRDAAKGLLYRMRYRMDSERPTVISELTVRNVGEEEQTAVPPRLYAINGIYKDDPSHEGYDSAVVWGVGGELHYDSYPDPDPRVEGAMPITDPIDGSLALDPARLDYVGLKSRFFTAFWKPGEMRIEAAEQAAVEESEEDRTLVADPDSVDPGLLVSDGYRIMVRARGFQQRFGDSVAQQAAIEVQYLPAGGQEIVLQPGEALKVSWSTTAASLRSDHLELLTESEQLIQYADWYYRFFKILVKPIAWLLGVLAAVLQSYALALIALVIIIKALLHRLNVKTQTSMMKMQKLAPELKRLQDQYKSDRQTLAMKQMEMFKKEGVNPVGGCLPMLLQMPIFIALYQTFRHSAEMRGSSFLWVDDLTLPDQLFHIWGPITLNPLPLLYIAISLAMSYVNRPKDQSQMTDQARQMQMMMRWMPIVFGFIFYNMPAGLVLYFVCSALIAFLEMRYIRKKLGMDGVSGLPTM